MTWIIGAPTLFGYSICFSDIQVSWLQDGKITKTKDCIQKIFPISRFFVIGFSGSVVTGFMVIEALQKLFNPLPSKNAWIPEIASIKIKKIATHVYKKQKEDVKKLGLSLLMVSVSPMKNNGIPNEATTQGFIFESPDFEPKPISMGRFSSIGSGSAAPIYADKLNKLNENAVPLMQMEVGNPKGYAQALNAYFSMVLKDNPIEGVSRYAHITVVDRSGISMGPNNYTANMGDLNEEKIIMPKVATTLKEFEEICRTGSVATSSAIA